MTAWLSWLGLDVPFLPAAWLAGRWPWEGICNLLYYYSISWEP